MPRCASCGEARDPGRMIGGVCVECVYKASSSIGTLSREKLEEARRAVEAETEGLVPEGALRDVFESFYEAMAAGAKLDPAIDSHVIMVKRLAGLGAARELLKITEALAGLSREVEEEVRRKMKRLADLGEGR